MSASSLSKPTQAQSDEGTRYSTLSIIQLPVPRLERDFSIRATLGPRISVGKGDWGQRNWITIAGGDFSATWGQGIIKPGGQDSQLVTDTLATRVEAHYLLQTADPDPAYLVVKTQGWRTGNRQVLERLFDPNLADDVDPSEYSFKIYISLETGDERYKFLNTQMWIGSGARRKQEVLYDAYRID